MISRTRRFTRLLFPTQKPQKRQPFFWGTVCVYQKPAKIAVVVSKKALKKAHERNQAKRRVYTIFNDFLPENGIVIHLRKEALTTNIQTIIDDIKHTLRAVK